MKIRNPTTFHVIGHRPESIASDILLRQRSGFVMIVVLALIVFAVTLLARFAQQSIGMASQAHRRERETQERWAVWSIASTTLSVASELLRPQESGQPRANMLETQIQVGDQTWQIRVHDLDTAINLNTVSRLTKAAGVQRLLRQSGFSSSVGHAKESENIDSWGQLLNAAEMSPQRISALQQECTCWSSGRLNLRHVSDRTLSRLGSILGRSGLYSRVIRERAAQETLDLKSLVEEAALSSEDQRLLESTLTDRSTSFSVMVWNSQSGHGVLQCILEGGDGTYADRHSVFRYDPRQ